VSAGVTFGLVLVVGAVALREAVRPAATPGLATRVSEDRTVSAPIVPRPGPSGDRVHAGLMVSSGERSNAPAGASPGAIDEETTEATIDSLVSADLMRMTPEERAAYIQRRIVRLQFHLQGQQDPAARP
jgi:hypothetical protein